METPEINLDPDDWEEFRKLGYEMIDLLVNYHQTVRDRPVWQSIPSEVKDRLKTPIPEKGKDLSTVFQQFKTDILPYPTGNIHPRFWGWVHGTGSSSGALAELLAAVMNPNTGGREHIANYVERQVIYWATQMLGYEINASGLLTSGCSMANLTGLAIARQKKSPVNVRERGLLEIGKKLMVYGSDQMHSSIQKSLEVLGMGSESLRIIPSNQNFEIRIDLLRMQLEEDIQNGLLPICVVGNAGTVNSGAMDDFTSLAQVAKEFNLWFHIDGAFGALARLLPQYETQMENFEQADSIAFDMHKWMYMPYEIGCILVRDEKVHRNTFTLRPDYLSQQTRGLASFDKWPTEYGVELSRGFRALKAWMLIQEHGIGKYRDVLWKNVRQARYFRDLVENDSSLELMAPVALNVICFRYIPPQGDNNFVEQVNRELLIRVQESGIAVFSSTQLKGVYTLRIANTNQRSEFADFDLLYQTLLDLGLQVTSELLQ